MAFIEPMHRNKPNITYLLMERYLDIFMDPCEHVSDFGIAMGLFSSQYLGIRIGPNFRRGRHTFTLRMYINLKNKVRFEFSRQRDQVYKQNNFVFCCSGIFLSCIDFDFIWIIRVFLFIIFLISFHLSFGLRYTNHIIWRSLRGSHYVKVMSRRRGIVSIFQGTVAGRNIDFRHP